MEALTLVFAHIRSVVLVALLLIAVCAHAQARELREPDDDSDTITTDRPDFTESALVVGRKAFQIESGFTYLRGDSAYVFGAPELLFRYGLGRKLEARLGLPNYTRIRTGGQTQAGFGATYLGVKYQIGPTRQGLDISLIPAVFAPTGGRAFNSGTWDPEIKLCLSKGLTDRFGVSGMLYGAWPTEDGRRNFTLQQTVSFGYALGGAWGSFYEFVNTFPERAASQHLFHSGVTYLLNHNSQLDFHFGFGLSREAPNHFVAMGYSVRFK